MCRVDRTRDDDYVDDDDDDEAVTVTHLQSIAGSRQRQWQRQCGGRGYSCKQMTFGPLCRRPRLGLSMAMSANVIKTAFCSVN